tara:strand:- start:10169 stop:14875 length:4707 start_codon:yes stop_codon:yes gene_type:complete
MSKSYRIRTTPGDSNGYLKVNLDLNQNYDHLEILSLKISQSDEYKNFCSDYGVVAGRVIINNGFGVPNVKVSIFVPVEDVDLNNPVISQLYPYTEPFPDQKNGNGIRYNVLPKNKQTLDHTPVGTFPKKREILDDVTTLEIYEKYYKYTTTTNKSGDYILFGIPVGDHYLHYDMDVSDIGFISSRPYELISQGYSDDLFNSRFKFKGSNNLDSLPQIFSENLPITVEPYWCDSLSVGSPLGINRFDIEPNIEVTPTSIFMGSIFSDDEKDSLNKNCKPAREMGKMNEVVTSSGEIESIRRNSDGGVETFKFNDNSIDENGNWSVLVPMNIRKVVTDEFGNLVPSPDGKKGIATEGDYRFRISMDATGNDKRLRQRAKFLVPNTNNNFNFDSYSQDDLKNSDDFTINNQLSTLFDSNNPSASDLSNQYNYLEEFYPFRWKKVYTVKQYIGRMQKVSSDEARGFIGIKDIINSEGVNKFPSNRLDTNINPLYTIICILLVYFGHLVGIINGIISIFNGLITTICGIKIPTGICSSTFKTAVVDVRYTTRRWCPDDSEWVSSGCGYGILANNNGRAQKVGNTGSSFIDMDAVSGGDFNGAGSDWTCNELSDDGLKGQSGWKYLNTGKLTTPISSGSAWYRFGDNGFATVHYGRYPNDGINSDFNPNKGGSFGLNNFICPGTETSSVGSGLGPSQPQNGLWCYNNSSCLTSGSKSENCVRWAFRDSLNNLDNLEEALDDCGKRTDGNKKQECKDDPNAITLLGRCWRLKKKCLFGAALCKNCRGGCPTDADHSCCGCKEPGCEGNCNASLCGGDEDGCCGDCCVKVPYITLKCADEELEVTVSLLPSIFELPKCNRNFVIPFNCINCGGFQTKGIKDWVSCTLEPVANFLKMLKFDFYNDWVGGTLYFPLIKRKYKLKKSKRKFGQIKKDKFCDFDCKIRNSNQFQGNPYFTQYRIKITGPIFLPPSINVNGCIAKIRGRRVSDWFGVENSVAASNLNLAAKSLIFKGKDSNGEDCNISFSSYNNFTTTLNPIVASSTNFDYEVQTKEVQTEHGKPEYIETEDANGDSTIKNIGGHGHHRNFCDNTRMVERKEYFKTSLDCLEPVLESVAPGAPQIALEIGGILEPTSPCYGLDCDPSCGSNGVAPCRNTNSGVVDDYNNPIIEHGLISWYDEEIYYTPVIPKNDLKYNNDEYKANLLLPTTIMELGSSVYCDIDDVPFIMDQLEPTTFAASFEDIKYRSDSPIPYNDGPDTIAGTDDDELGELRVITKFEDKKDSSLNLRAYVEFGCASVVCVNTSASVNQSQVGVDILDKNDIGVEIGNCFVRFEHDEDIRSYFCRRFNGYKSADLNFHHSKPGSVAFDNVYNTYPEITLNDGNNLYYEFPTGEIVKSEYNDSDSFIPGDGCGYYRENSSPDYFYGLAPGQTSSFINYPNSDTTGGASGTINFGDTAHSDGVDEVNDANNGLTSINGIRFNRSQTPYYLYFGLVPGKTALHKTVSKFFADKINAVTLQGLGASDNNVSENINNSPNLNNPEDNPFTIYKTCLGETLISNTPEIVITGPDPNSQANNNQSG